jgi:hypothetical protein
VLLLIPARGAVEHSWRAFQTEVDPAIARVSSPQHRLALCFRQE